jgi:hypothetical protein
MSTYAGGSPEFYLDTTLRDLEAALHAVAAAMAAEKGVEVKETHLALRSVDPQTVDFEVRCLVKAMLMSTSVTLSGRAKIDSDLQVRVAEIQLAGEGMMAGMAKSFIEPQLARVRGKSFPLANVKIPGLKIQTVALEIGDRVRLSARFASKD